MISIENFYYVLYRHLLKPMGILDGMFTRFGSTDFLDFIPARYGSSLFQHSVSRRAESSCYYFDQEPIYTNNISDLIDWESAKGFRMVANSEISELKTSALKEHNFQDWYYFFHGFAALAWYQDGKFFYQDVDWTKPYISMNRLHTNGRSYRLNLVARLAEQKILDRGYVSLHLDHSEYGTWQQELVSPGTKLSKSAQELIARHLSTALVLDKSETTGSISADFGHQEFDLWKSGLWHIVTETVFYYNKLHLTEKIFKPIVAQRPFILAAAPGNLAYLKSYGFKSFDKWIDESYDTIQDPDLRLQAIVDQTQRLCAMSNDQLHQMHQEMQPILEHNFNHMWGDFRHRIVNELVDNFERLVRVWNNGRVDGRSLPLQNIDTDKVKQILLR